MFGKTTYVVAVSGGVDSVVLLDMLVARQPEDVLYIVAHFDHGIREDSAKDAEFVQRLVRGYGLECVVGAGELGVGVSEAEAREARYRFLRSVAEKYKAEKIITAHHQDDFLETIVLGLLRTTSYRALIPMQGQGDILRPLMNKTKADILAYAAEHKLQWREDATNQVDIYLRNYIRIHIMPKLASKRDQLLQQSRAMEALVHEIDSRVLMLLPRMNSLSRSSFVCLPWVVQKECMYAWLLKNGVEPSRKRVERAALAVKTLPVGKRFAVAKGVWLISQRQNVLLASE